ncbi:G-protein coupled receptor moody [Patella vulgata]|uniref:G-protein coupled receptor moody n=1 Tax=Patella vulgata TaxID=6465 RepID=UPI00217FF1E4|nr:G-protein coupled receptor moody [Patella vulgata]
MNVGKLFPIKEGRKNYLMNVSSMVDESSSQLKVDVARETVSLYTAVILMAIIIIVGCVGNVMVILAVKTNKKLQSESNKFVVNLSVCDLLFVTMVLPFNIYTYIEDDWFLDHILCKFIGFLGYTLTGTTIITITLIAWNRYKLILDPAGYKSIFAPRNLKIMIVVAWVFPVICLLPALTEIWGKFGYVAMLVTCNLMLNHESQSFKLFLLIVRAAVPCILIVYYYMMIYYTTRQSHLRMSRSISKSAIEYNNHRKEMHLTRMMIIIFLVFILSYFPCTVSSVIDWNRVLSKRFHMFCIITVYVGSALNPLIYGLMNSQFRLAYFRLLSCYQIGTTAKSKQVKKDTVLNVGTPIVRKKITLTPAGFNDDMNQCSSSDLLKRSNVSLPDLYKLSVSYEDEEQSTTTKDGSEVYVRLLEKSEI